VTGKSLLLHLEMTSCSKQLMPQGAVSRVGHDGKEVKDVKEIDSNVAEDLDPWHFQKLEIGHFVDHCTNATGDSKEVKQLKMMKRKNLFRLKEGLGFHLTRCLKCCFIVLEITNFALMKKKALFQWASLAVHRNKNQHVSFQWAPSESTATARVVHFFITK